MGMGESLAGALTEVARQLADGEVGEGLQLLVERTAERIADADAWAFLGAGSAQEAFAASTTSPVPQPPGGGPCTDAVRCGDEVVVGSAAELHERWGDAVAALVDAGYGPAHAIPLGVNGKVVGCLLVARRRDVPFDEEEQDAARAFAALASVGLSLHRSEETTAQLQHALDARVTVEQAKGLVAATLRLTVTEALDVLRGSARDRNVRLAELASEVLVGRVRPEDLARSSRS